MRVKGRGMRCWALGAPGTPSLLHSPSGRFPFYYEIKMAFVVWLLSPYTKGASLLYRKFVHPTLSRREKVTGLHALTSLLGFSKAAVPP